ncbi:MAG: L-serine ammonia-lyase, iron-sulfur-dependent, subunit alpha [Spirochaetaceae bacterium]|nr:L-serine ammonia-lyase, iron-sulfur-dependent, subunit alpha [Spirochaetaceae bacterium]
MIYDSVSNIVSLAENSHRPISAIVLESQAEEMQSSVEEVFAKMEVNYKVMKEASEAGRDEKLRSASGLVGGDAFRLFRRSESGGLVGSFLLKAMARSMGISEYNSSMGKIVAAPTAGSCGILPSAVITVAEEFALDERKAVMSLFTAGAFGLVIAKNASISGAEGGCQAECGSASAMAAAAIVELMDGSPHQCGEACAIALKSVLGLVCDPVAGLVEIPCVKRNVSGLTLAFTAAEMALAGIESRIPPDEVILAMDRIGAVLPDSLRERGTGGLAATPTGIRLKREVFGG